MPEFNVSDKRARRLRLLERYRQRDDYGAGCCSMPLCHGYGALGIGDGMSLAYTLVIAEGGLIIHNAHRQNGWHQQLCLHISPTEEAQSRRS